MASLLQPRDIVTSLIDSLYHPDEDQESSNPLRHASQQIQNTLLTLHVLFPNELLPALDVLDRGLVIHMLLQTAPNDKANSEDGERGVDQLSLSPTQMYLVRSGQQASRLRQANYTSQYEVRLTAWSCSCPAFAFSAFPATSLEQIANRGPPAQCVQDAADGKWKIGGVSTGIDVPICKHLLACALVEHGGVFAGLVERRRVSVDEMAGWAAGWGD